LIFDVLAGWAAAPDLAFRMLSSLEALADKSMLLRAKHRIETEEIA
jgi:hypothetical protein